MDGILGGNARLTCQIIGSASRNLRVQWVRMNGQPLPTNSYENNGELFIQNVQTLDGGRYTTIHIKISFHSFQ